jgi:hypothetical protein
MWPLVVVGVLAAGFALWWAFIRPGQVQDAAAVTKAQATVVAAAPEIARETLREVERTHEKTIQIVERTRAGNAQIAAAAGASARVPADVDAAGRAALCLHALYRDDPGCTALPGLRAGGDMGAGAGGAAAAGR